MTRNCARALSMVLIVTMASLPLAAQSAAPDAKLRPAMDPGKLKAMLMNVPTGGPLRLRTRDGAELAGKLTQLTNEGLQIQALAGGTIENRTVNFTDIAGLAVGPKKSVMARVLGPVLTVSSLVGTVAAITAAVKK